MMLVVKMVVGTDVVITEIFVMVVRLPEMDVVVVNFSVIVVGTRLVVVNVVCRRKLETNL